MKYVRIKDGMKYSDDNKLMGFANDIVESAGVVDKSGGDFLVRAQISPNMSLRVNPGTVYIENSSWVQNGNETHYFQCFSTEIENLNINSNSSGSARVDLVCAKIDKVIDPGEYGELAFSLVIVVGVPAAGVPATPANHYKLAEIAVASGATSITSGNLTDRRVDFTIRGGTTLSKATAVENVAGTDDSKYLTALANVPAFNNSLYRQAIINGNFDVWQRGTSFTASAPNDDVYTADRWNSLTEGNDVIDVAQTVITDLPKSNYSYKAIAGSTTYVGLAQFIEAKDAQKFKGKSVSVSFAVKSATLTAVRCAVLSWGSTADSITSDVVATWGATPTWATNWTAENTPANLTVTSSWTTVKVENIAIDSATVNNLALVIWTPAQMTSTQAIDIAQVQLCAGDVALPFMPKSFDDELRACKRYANKISPQFLYGSFATGWAESATIGQFIIPLGIPMRGAPSLTTLGNFRLLNSAAVGAVSGVVVIANSDPLNPQVTVTVASGMAAGQCLIFQNNNDLTASLIFTCEL